jgi:hypothetical protein
MSSQDDEFVPLRPKTAHDIAELVPRLVRYKNASLPL